MIAFEVSEMERREQALQSIEAELKQERALALGRAGKKLESLVQEAERAHEALQNAPPEDRPRAHAAFEEVRERASYQLWCYVVQREAVGINNHAEVYEAYRIPESLRDAVVQPEGLLRSA